MSSIRAIMLGLVTFGVFSVLGLTAAYAQKPVKLKVAVIHASKSVAKIDKRISKRLAKSLKTESAFSQFKGFRLVSKSVLKLARGKAASVELPTQEKAVITYEGKAKRKHKLGLSIPKHKIQMKLKTPQKKLFYQAGIRHDQGILILAFYLKE